MLSNFAQFLSQSYADLSCASKEAAVYVIGQPAVDAMGRGYDSTMNYLSNTGQATVEFIQRVFGY